MYESVTVHIGPAIAAMAEIDKRSDRACMWGLREAGRQTKRAERKKVPVLTGQLRDSLGAGRLKTVSHRNYRLTVTTRGPNAYKYAAKIEEVNHYMQQAFDQVSPKFPGICTKAMDRVVAKYGNVTKADGLR